MWIVVFWIVTPCSLVGAYQRFGGTYRLHLQGSFSHVGRYQHFGGRVKMKEIRSSETSVTTYKKTRCYNPEDLQSTFKKKFRSHVPGIFVPVNYL
jgi:hypothetical protein